MHSHLLAWLCTQEHMLPVVQRVLLLFCRCCLPVPAGGEEQDWATLTVFVLASDALVINFCVGRSNLTCMHMPSASSCAYPRQAGLVWACPQCHPAPDHPLLHEKMLRLDEAEGVAEDLHTVDEAGLQYTRCPTCGYCCLHPRRQLLCCLICATTPIP